MIRRPIPQAELYAWHTQALIDVGFGLLSIPNVPEAGWYKRRLVRGGMFVPAKIWLEQHIDPETGELIADSRWLCEVANIRKDPDEQWEWLSGHPISEADFRFMMAERCWAAEHAPYDPVANPRKPVDWRTAPLPEF
jgi:hypothetical protein